MNYVTYDEADKYRFMDRVRSLGGKVTSVSGYYEGYYISFTVDDNGFRILESEFCA